MPNIFYPNLAPEQKGIGFVHENAFNSIYDKRYPLGPLSTIERGGVFTTWALTIAIMLISLLMERLSALFGEKKKLSLASFEQIDWKRDFTILLSAQLAVFSSYLICFHPSIVPGDGAVQWNSVTSGALRQIE